MNAAFLDVAVSLIEWLAGDFCHDQDLTGLIEGLGVRLSNAGIRLDRLGLHVLMIDPEILGRTLAWSPARRSRPSAACMGLKASHWCTRAPFAMSWRQVTG